MRKRSGSNKMFYLCESEAAATKCFICAKAKRQQQNVLSVRKRSGSNKMFYLCESEAAATKRVTRSGNQPLRMYKNG
ncbi:hypothetical protein [Lysinibacillus sp. G4S2]|uniref:hypothetical protein n=1 Tax=Lysinibacillus sp. G4S2 TaxID=3055859 RepID=UPI0025A2DABD|nr:hypothetical protein [Lysinibacillus sp. G4S2]MDM5247250.1 hypothetical protein [Lysinibacillus sp. G4S2]